MDKANLENINEDGHTDVASSKRKVMIMVDDSNKLLNKLNGMNKEDSLPSWWSDKITLSQNYLEKATNYLLNPVESVNENILTKQLSKMINEPESSIVKFMKKTGYDEATLLDFVEKLTRNNSRLRKIHTTILKNAIKGDKKSEKSIKKTLYGESINESSVSQVRSTISRVKKQLMKKWAKKGGYENFGQKELRKMKDKLDYNPYGSPQERQISKMLDAFNDWAMNYSGDMRESVNEGKGVEKVLKMANDQSFGKLGGRTVDALSAGLFKGVYDKAPQNAKDKINKMNEKQLYVFMTKLWSKFGNQVRIG
jgi:hypothetical protein